MLPVDYRFPETLEYLVLAESVVSYTMTKMKMMTGHLDV
jgi:hypothetical protein